MSGDPQRWHRVFNDIHQERERQDQRWDEQNRCPIAYVAICTEELGEVTKEALTLDLVPNHPKTPEVRENYRKELVQLAACVVAAIEAFDRGKWTPGDIYSRNGFPEN